MPSGIYKRTKITIEKLRLHMRTINNGKDQKSENNPMWKGEKAGYFAQHKWVNRYKGRPSKCEDCGTTSAKRYEWANLSGEYKRDLGDYIRLCSSCHHIKDNLGAKMRATRIKNGSFKFYGNQFTS